MRIAELEQRTGVSRHTLRYYEKQGLLLAVARSRNNYRDYPQSAVREVNLLCQMKALGFSLKEIGEVLEALRARRIDCAAGAALMREKRRLVETRIADLKRVRALLKDEESRLDASARRSGRNQ